MHFKKVLFAMFGATLLTSVNTAQAVPVDLELILATDVSGSVDGVDFAARRSGIEAAFRDADVIDAITNGAIGGIAVTLWDFADDVSVGVDWYLITDAASSNAFADLVAASTRASVGCCDGQSNLLDMATAAILADNGYEGTREVIDITSEGAQDIDGCQYDSVTCVPTQTARDNFLAAGGDAINAIWMNDRDFFGLDPTDLINAFEYGTNNVIGGIGSFQVFAETNEDFVSAIKAKIIREVEPPTVPEPSALLLLGLGLAGLGFSKRKKV